ncbi:MAG: SH3 domain-containing protein [Victivallaceae bacterium]|nr:SH3 domain-containing protein [Victivallaceae bacterium]
MSKLIILLPALLLAFAVNADAVVGKVRPEKLNVRIQPVANAGVVAKLPRGTEVKIAGVEGAWYKIELPENADAYVAADYVQAGKTIARVQMRYGAGVAFHSYGVIPMDTKLEVVSDKNPKWLKIKPPQGFFAYVSSPHVAVSDADYQKMVGSDQAVAPSSRSGEAVAKVEYSSIEDAVKGFELMRGWFNGAPTDITVSGVLLKTDSAATGAGYALARREADGKLPVLGALYEGKVDWSQWSDRTKPAALKERAVDLSGMVGREVTISGKKLEVPNWSYPYIVVTKVEEKAGAPAAGKSK